MEEVFMLLLKDVNTGAETIETYRELYYYFYMMLVMLISFVLLVNLVVDANDVIF